MRKAYFFTLLFLAAISNGWGQFAGGTGTSSNPYQIATAEHLDNIRTVLSADTQFHFIQTADIDLSGYTNWEPIGGGGTEVVFNGFYNGQHFSISNLTITRAATNDVGLFGHVASGDVSFGQFTRIRNIILENAEVTGNNAVGALVGRVTGSGRNVIEDCFIISGNVTGDMGVGGLVGVNNSFLESVEGQEGPRPIIRRCYSNIDVIASGGSTSESIGGLVGCNSRAQIVNSHAAGNISGFSASKVGGLAGSSEELAIIENSFSTGIVDASGSNIGGLLGSLGSGEDAGTVTASYWDTETSGQTSSAGGEGRTTAQMQNQSNYSGWNFSTIWNIFENEYYPFLRNHNLSGFDLTDPGQLNAGQSFDLEITNAFDVGAFIQEGDYQVTVTSNIETEGSNGLLFEGEISFLNGIAEISDLVLSTSGEQVITVNIFTILNEEQILVDVAAGPAVKLLILEQPSVVMGNNDDQPALIPTIVVASVDVFDNVSGVNLPPNQEVLVTLLIDGSPDQDAILGNDIPVVLVNGIAAFENLTLDKEGTGYVLRFISDGNEEKVDLGFADSDPFDVIQIVDLSGFLVEEPLSGETRLVLEPFNVVISQATGVMGNLLSSNTNVQILSSQEGQILNQGIDFSDGEAIFPIALENTGLHDLTITINGITQSVIIEDLDLINDLSDFVLELDPPAGPFYEALPFILKIKEATDVTGKYISEAAVTVTSNLDGQVFDQQQIAFTGNGEADIEIVLETLSDPNNHTLSVEIETVTGFRTIEVMVQENVSGVIVELADPSADIIAGEEFELLLSEAFNILTPAEDFSGLLNVQVISDIEGEVFNGTRTFNSGESNVFITLEIADNHDLSVKIETISFIGTLENVLVLPAEADTLVIVSDDVADISGNNDGQAVKIGNITLEIQDRFGNLTSTNLSPTQMVSVSIHPDSEGGGTFTPGSTLEMDISSGTTTFNNLFINDEGVYKLEFVSIWDGTQKTAETNLFTISDINNQAGFDIVDPGPQVAGQSFTLNIINATDSQGNLINDTKSLLVIRIAPTFLIYYNEPTEFIDGAASISITIIETGITTLSVTFDNTLTETIDITVVAEDDSEFSITPPGSQVAGVPFDLGITNAKDKAGNDLDGRKHLVTVTSDNTNEGTGGLLFNDSIQFTGGSALTENLTLFIAEEQNLTVTIDWITAPVSQAVVVEPNTATQFVFEQQPTGFADGEYEGTPRPVGTVVLQTLDDYDNLSMEGLTAPLTVTAAINTGPAEAELGGDLELNLTDAEVTFEDLTLDRNGTYTLSFTFNGIADPAFAPNPLISDEFDMVNIEDFSEFTVLDPGNQYENIPFVLQLVNATDKFGSPLNGEFNLILESDQIAEGVNGEIYNMEFTFVNGELDLPLTLTTVAIHELTITLDGLNSNNIAVINVEVLPDLSAFALDITPDPLVTPVYQNNPFDLIIFDAIDLDGLALDGNYQVIITSDVTGEEEIFEGEVIINEGLGFITLTLPTITTYLLTVEVEGITEYQSISVEVLLNPSGFTAELADPADKVAGVDFDINLTDAIGLDGNVLGETSPALHRVVITSNLSGVEFDADVEFDAGDALVTLNIELAAPLHTLTIAVTGITPTEELTVTVIPAQVSQLLLTVDDPPLGGTGTGNDTPTGIGTIIINTADEFGNLSTEGISGTQEVTAGISTDGSIGQNAELGGDLTKNIVSGVATFDDLTLDKDGVGYVLQFVYSGTPDLELGSVFTDLFDMQDVNLYQISLRNSENEELDIDVNPLVFDGAVEGYPAIDEEIITILRIGEGDITGILVELDTEGATHFTITQPLADEIAGAQTSTTFTIEPNTGLTEGVYEAVVTVTANNDISEEFAVFFTVLTPYAITITDNLTGLPVDGANPVIFDPADPNYTAETRTLTVTNTGWNAISGLQVFSDGSTGFVFTDLPAGNLNPGQSATFTISAKTNLSPGFYKTSFSVRDSPKNVEVRFDAEFEVREYTFEIAVEPDPSLTLVLPSLPEGYTNPADAAREVTITRTGTGPVNNIEVVLLSGSNERFQIFGPAPADLDGNTENSTSFIIQPLGNLPAQVYSDVIRITADDIDEIDINVSFEVIQSITWTGAVSSAWQNPDNWNPAIVPNNTYFVYIPDVSSSGGAAPEISSLVSLKNLVMEESSSLTINHGTPRLSILSEGNFILKDNSEITVNGGLRILSNAVMTMQPGSRATIPGTLINEHGANGLIIKSSQSKTASLIHNSLGVQATVERWLNGRVFHIVSSPVIGQTIEDFVASNPVSFNPTGNFYAMQVFNEEQNAWSEFFPANITGPMNQGSGYSIRIGPSGGAAVTFKGTLKHNSLSRVITRQNLGWNAIGNPFASSIGVTKNAISSFLSDNTDKLDPEYAGLWVYDAVEERYIIINNVPQNGSNVQDYLALAQGFIVRANESTENLSVEFSPELRHHYQADYFKNQDAGQSWYSLRLKATGSNNGAVLYSESTLVAFNTNMSKGLDVTYDAGQYKPDPLFNLFTRMPDGISDLNMAIQALPEHGLEDVLIPVGLSFPQGGDVTFTAEYLHLPDHFFPRLYDSQENIYIDLNQESYTLTLDPDPDLTGRFFLLMKSQIMHLVNFGTMNDGGEILASANGDTIEPGTMLPDGASVAFFAHAYEGFQIEEWIIDGVVLDDVSVSEILFDDLDADIDVQVRFKATSTHIDEQLADDNLIIYIFENQLIIRGEIGENAIAVLYDMLGRQMRVEQLQPGEFNAFSVEGLKTGAYVIHILENDRQSSGKLLLD